MHLKNWRPLNLINLDTKMFTKSLALKIIPALSDLIHHNQTAYVKGRYIGEGIKTIEGIMEYVKEHRLETYILAIDFEKAFDSLEWDFLWAALKSYGIPDFYINAVKTVYKNIETSVINGGWSSKYFQILRGCRQGDPLSAILFILALELFLIRVRKNKDIKGITIGNQEIKLCSYADDLTNFLADSQSVLNLFCELERFSRYSGLRCNVDKTEAMKLGCSNMNHGNELQIKMVDVMKVTGVYFSFDKEKQQKENYKEINENLRKLLKLWKQRGISLIGRVQIIKTFAFSKIRFITNFVEPSPAFVTEFNEIVKDFLWDGGSAKIKKSAIIANYENGGLKFPDFYTILESQKIMWIKRFYCSTLHPWKTIFEYELNKIGGVKVLENTGLKLSSVCKMAKNDLDIVIAWGKYNKKPITSANIKNQHLYNNEAFKKPNSDTIFYKNLAEKGIVYVKDIIQNARIISPDIMRVQKDLNPSEVLQYLSICACINNDSRDLIREELPLQPDVNYQLKN